MHMARRLALVAGLLSGALTLSACGAHGAAQTPAPFPSLGGPNAHERTSVAPSLMDAVVQTALSLRGTRYRLGGQDPKRGMDCSGLVHFVFGQMHLDVPRSVVEQFSTGYPVEFDSIQAGDLLFFATTPAGLKTGSATHVGIAIATPTVGEFVHAPGSGSAVRVDRFDAPYWRARWVGARRLLDR
jgi:cell wall-associated NlpC family hydrolase